MKTLVRHLIISTLIFQASFSALAAEPIVSRPYVSRCEEVLDIIRGPRVKGDIEKKFISLAQEREQMLQLLKDYDLIFSKEFAESMLLSLDEKQFQTQPPLQQIKTLRKFASLPDAEFDKFSWKIFERLGDLMTKERPVAQGQLRHLQASEFIEKLKDSPHRGLAQKLISIMVRDSLLRAAKNVRTNSRNIIWETLKTRVFKFLLATIPLGAAWGWVYHPMENQGPLGGAFMFAMIGTMAGMVGGLFSAAYSNFNLDRFANKIPPPVDFVFVDSLGKNEKIASNQVFDFMEEAETTSVFPIDQVCQTPTCLLTPVQIAYLGHIDVLELEAINNTLKDLMKVSTSSQVNKVSDKARAVYDDSENLDKQLDLRIALSDFLDMMKGLLNSKAKAVETLKGYASAISQTSLQALAQKPFVDVPNREDNTLNNHLLREKVEADAKSLENIKINTEILARKIARNQLIVDTLTGLLDNLPKNPAGWKEAAEDVLIKLDELNQ